MKLRILPSAVQDLHRGREFYARQSDSLGDYFLDSLFSDVDSLELYAGVHAKVFGYHRLLADGTLRSRADEANRRTSGHASAGTTGARRQSAKPRERC